MWQCRAALAAARLVPAIVRLTVGAPIREATGEDWNERARHAVDCASGAGLGGAGAGVAAVDGDEQARQKVLVQSQERREQLAAGGGGCALRGPRGAALDEKGNCCAVPARSGDRGRGRLSGGASVDVVEEYRATVKLGRHVEALDEHARPGGNRCVRNPAAYPLLEGRVRSYRNGSYVGDSRLAPPGRGRAVRDLAGRRRGAEGQNARRCEDKDEGAGFLSSTKHIVRAYPHQADQPRRPAPRRSSCARTSPSPRSTT